MKRTPKKALTTQSLRVPPRVESVDPEFFRLPKPWQLCPCSGLTRSAINELILPTIRNNYKPSVRSFCLRQKGARTGIRLIDLAGLENYVRAHAEPVAA